VRRLNDRAGLEITMKTPVARSAGESARTMTRPSKGRCTARGGSGTSPSRYAAATDARSSAEPELCEHFLLT